MSHFLKKAIGGFNMEIKKAQKENISDILKLLKQVAMVHHKGRPDIFKAGTKYSEEEIKDILKDNNTPIFISVENNKVLGYAFCVIKQYINSSIMTDIKTLYIDDLCVDEKLRGKNIGKNIYEYVVEYAKKIGCYNVTLNVWSCNKPAKRFYEKCGLVPQKIGMETIL